MIIGEAPGFEEMKQGIPFCGRSGKLLDECLEKNNIDNYIITNMVKCHPPDNRAPTHEEIQTCEMWLLNQISEMKPKRIVLLGAIALKYFFPTERISLANGKVFKWAGIDCIPMYHPAYILRNGNKMRDEYIKGFDIINKMEAC
jgi:DNA polymerase